MFAFGKVSGKGVTSVKLTANLPLELYLIDLGGGLQAWKAAGNETVNK